MGNEIAVGIDVSARTLAVASQAVQGAAHEWEVPNDAAGHQRLVRRLTQLGGMVRVCVEATGIYHFDLAVALAAAPGVTVMVANPRATKAFARATLQRSKTDRVDARLLVAFVQRMPFVPWTAPRAAVLHLRALTRRITVLTRARVQEKNRLHMAAACADLPAALTGASRAHIAFLETSMRELTAAAQVLVAADAGLSRQYAQLLSIPGIGERSALRLLAELAGLPPDMTVRQWVAHAGLDPRHFESGSSIHRAPRISRTGNGHLRGALYMPALVATRCDPHVGRWSAALRARGKKPKQALTAVMRKLLHAIYGMFRSDQLYDPTKCYPLAA